MHCQKKLWLSIQYEKNIKNCSFISTAKLETLLKHPNLIHMWKLSLYINGGFIKEITIEPNGNEIIIGREADPDKGIRIEGSSNASRQHCSVFMEGDRLNLMDLNSTNGTYLNGERLAPHVPYALMHTNEFHIGKNMGVVIRVTQTITKPKLQSSSVKSADALSLDAALETLQQRKRILIGRGDECDYIIHQPNVSRKHASIYIDNGDYYLEDLNSTNGVYINQQKLFGRAKINANDTITIGDHTFTISAGLKDETHLLAIQAIGIEKKFKNNKIGLHEMNLNVEQGKLLGIMGPSGCGKSTLLKAMIGEAPITKGKILIKGWDLIENYDLVKTYIGYVPQDDILHKDLTVEQSLYYTAKLRLADPTEEYIEERIKFVLQRLMIDKVRKSKISDLSGGQRKRVCIASELLTSPAILFLDEPTSPLDPQTIEEFLKILTDLAHDGTTVLMVTHKPEDLEYLDKVVFLTTGGHMVFYDKVSEINTYFNVNKITRIYSKIDNPSSEETKSWIDKYHKITKGKNAGQTIEKQAELKKSTFPFWLQIFWLVRRNLSIKLNDKSQLAVPIIGPPLITFVFCLLFNNITLQVLFLIAVTSIFFGVFTSCGEIVKEQQIYTRERMFNLRILPYLLSKVIMAACISAIQAGLMVLIILLRYKSSEIDLHLNNPSLMFIWLFITYMCASIIGLFISAVCKKMEQVNMWVPYVVLLQIIFSGVMTKLKDKGNIGHTVSTIMISRWSTEGLTRIQDTIAYDATPASFIKQPTMPAMAQISFQPPANQSSPVNDSTVVAADSNIVTHVQVPIKQVGKSGDTTTEDSTKKEGSNFKKVSAQAVFLENFPVKYREAKMNAFGSLSNTPKLNIIMLVLIFFTFFGSTYYSLKKKDTI